MSLSAGFASNSSWEVTALEFFSPPRVFGSRSDARLVFKHTPFSPPSRGRFYACIFFPFFWLSPHKLYNRHVSYLISTQTGFPGGTPATKERRGPSAKVQTEIYHDTQRRRRATNYRREGAGRSKEAARRIQQQGESFTATRRV